MKFKCFRFSFPLPMMHLLCMFQLFLVIYRPLPRLERKHEAGSPNKARCV